MKKHSLIISLFLICFSINAQNSKVNFGVKAGVNLSKYTPEKFIGNVKIADYEHKIGFFAGGYVNIEISEKLKIQPELLFSTQGTKIVDDNVQVTDGSGVTIGTEDLEVAINESTISLPVVLQFYINDNFNIEGGVQFGYIVNRKEEVIKHPFKQVITNSSINSSPSYDKFDFGLNFGLGYKLYKSFRVNAKYFYGVIKRDNLIKPSIFSLGVEYDL